MAKKDDDLIAKLSDIIDRNTKAFELLAQSISNQPAAPVQTPVVKQPDPPAKQEEKPPVAPAITLEQCREVIMEIDQKGVNREVALTFLSRYNAKTMKEVKESDYAEFIKLGMVLVGMYEKKEAEASV